MRDVLEAVDRWVAEGERVATAVVVTVKRSAPRPPGAKMAVSSSGAVCGQVSGGCVEGAVVQAAQEVIDGGPPRLLCFGIEDADAWSVGLPCGGEITVWVSGALPRAFAQAAREGRRAGLATRMDDGRTLVVDEDGVVEGDLGDPRLTAAATEALRGLLWAERSELRTIGGVDVFLDVTFPDPRLLIVGAVDIAVPLCRIARHTGWRPSVADPRGFFARADRFPEADHVIAAWPHEAVARFGGLDRATSVVVLTHDPKIDDAALELALRSDAAYVGAMGSRRAQQTRHERLRAAGFTDEDLSRLAAPVGLDLGALTPEETALSIMAEVVAVRRGRSGARLRDTAGRIHEVTA
jgi:xanthine dehydrogenase accessory factor